MKRQPLQMPNDHLIDTRALWRWLLIATDDTVGIVDLVDVPYLHFLVGYHLVLHVLEESDLLSKELLEVLGCKLLPRTALLAHFLELCTDTLLHHCEAVLREFRVECREVRDGTNSGEDRVVTRERRTRTE